MAESSIPRLLVPRESAAQAIAERIAVGKSIADNAGQDRDSAERDYQKWSDYTNTLLESFFDSSLIWTDFRATGALSEISWAFERTDWSTGRKIRSSSERDPVVILRRRIGRQIQNLDSLLERLSLFPAAAAGEAAPRATVSFVNESRLSSLRGVPSSAFDLKRLVRMCEELNACYAVGAYHAVGMLLRAILDHVPPIFGAKSFQEVVSSRVGAKSTKEALEHLQNGARKIGDMHLHVQIRKVETLPNETQVNFSAPLDVLLAEIERALTP